MLIYENAFPTTYEEIKTWYPVWYRDVFEMEALWRVLGGQMDSIQADIIQMVENNFIEFADAPTVTKLEEFYGIVHPFPRTLVERRAVLIGFVRGRGHIGRPKIIELISLFTTGEIDVAFSRPGKVDVTVTRDFGDMFNLADVHMILGHRIPAHLTLGVIDLPRPVWVRNENNFIFRNLWMWSFRIINKTARMTGTLLNGEHVLDGSWTLNMNMEAGLNFIDFHVKARIENRGEIVFGPSLDAGASLGVPMKVLDGDLTLDGLWHLNGGGLTLDGSWPLTAGNIFTLRDMSGRNLAMSIFQFSNSSELKLQPFNFFFRFLNRTAGFTGPALDGEYSLDGFWLLESTPPGIGFVNFSMGARVSNWIAHAYGEILDGSRDLDGVWELYADSKKIHSTMASRALDMGVYEIPNTNKLGNVTLTHSSVWSLDGDTVLDGARNLDKLIIKEVV